MDKWLSDHYTVLSSVLGGRFALIVDAELRSYARYGRAITGTHLQVDIDLRKVIPAPWKGVVKPGSGFCINTVAVIAETLACYKACKSAKEEYALLYEQWPGLAHYAPGEKVPYEAIFLGNPLPTQDEIEYARIAAGNKEDDNDSQV